MRIIVNQNNFKNIKGVTLVEVMIALVILLVVFMGLLQASILTIDVNLRNALRDEAARIASDEIVVARSMPFDALATTATAPVSRSFRSAPAVIFSRTRTVVQPSGNNKIVTVSVTWSYRAENFTHTINAMVSR